MDTWIQKIKTVNIRQDFITYPFYIISRPFKAFGELKYEKQGKMYFVVVMMVLLSLFSIFDEMYKGFVLSGGYYVENKTVFAPYLILMTLAPVALFVIGNWSITAITDGNGKMKEIFMVYAYASYPQLLLQIIGLVLSNFVAADEAAFALFFYSFGAVAFAFYLFVGLTIIHDYTFTKAVLMIVLTVAAMCIIVFILALFLSLSKEVYEFIKTIYQEIVFKL